MARLEQVLWIGGAQWAGKTSVARALAAKHHLQLYEYDPHDARDHRDRALVEPERFPAAHFIHSLTPDEMWVDRSPAQMAEDILKSQRDRFAMVLDDLAALPDDPLVLAEGWGLRPQYLAPLLHDTGRAVWIVPSEDFRLRQLAAMPRAHRLGMPTSDPNRAQANRLDRDRLLAEDVTAQARRWRLPFIVVDGREDLAQVAARVEALFGRYLAV